MKRTQYHITAICIFLIHPLVLHAQVKLLAIDSLYLASIERFYEDAESAKEEIWKGMKLAPVCLYRINGPALLFNHPKPPSNFIKLKDNLYIGPQKGLQLFGATQIEINGILTAIANYDLARYSNIEEAYAELFHELHHVYQRNFVKQIGFDNPATLLAYPENYINDGIKLFEQNTLFKMCFEKDRNRFQKLLNQFYSCRLERKQIIGSFLSYEETVESMEGPAFFCEYQYVNRFSPVNEALKDNYNQKHFYGFLTNPYYGRDNLRNRHLAAGMAMCLILNNFFDDWQLDYYSGNLSLYDFFMSKFKPQKEDLEIDPMYYDLSKFHIQQAVLKHQLSLGNFNAQPGTKVVLEFKKRPQFKGFDPMHAEAINDSTILHKTLLSLSGNESNSLFFDNKDVITLIDGEVWFVKKVVLFAREDNIVIKGGRILIDSEGGNVSWKGELKMKSEGDIFFICE